MKRRIIGLLVMILLLPGVASAQGGGDLPFDAPVEATLSAGETHTYTFRSEGTDSITVRMMAAALDPVLVLYDPVGNLLAFNDDTEGETDAALVSVRLPMAGVYTLVARSYGNRGAGAYTLRAISRRAETLDGSAPLDVGETIDAELFTVGQTDRWLFDGQAGQVISVRMDAERGTRLDPLLELLAAEGTVLAYSDDDGGDKNSLINGFELPEDGQYVIVARSWGNATIGAYTLALAEGVLATDQAITVPYSPGGMASETQGAADAVPRNDAGPIAVGDEALGVLAQGIADVWTLELPAPLVLDLALVAVEGAFDPRLVLEDDAGDVLAENDDAGAGLDSALRGVALEAGRYTLVVRSYADVGQGAYVLAVRAFSEPEVNTGPVMVGSPQSATLAPGAEDRWTLEVDAGDVITVAVYAGANAFDSVLRVFGPDGLEVVSDDDSGPYYNPMLIGWTVPETGTYTLAIRGYDPAMGGDYEIVVVPGAAFVVPGAWRQGELAFDTPTDVTFEDGTAHLWTFTVPQDQDLALEYAGGVVIELRGVDGSPVPVFEPGERMRLEPGADYDLFVYGPVGRDYSLELRRLDPPAVNAGSIAVDDTRTATLAVGAADRWTFEGTFGQLVSLSLVALDGAFDPLLAVVDANGVVVVQDDDGGLLRNSAIVGLRLPAEGTYTALVRAYDDRSGGTYALTLQEGGSLIIPEAWQQGPLEQARPVQGMLAARQPAHVWTFTATSGQVVTLAYDAPLAIEIVSEDGDTEGMVASGTPVILNHPGTFNVVVSRVTGAPLDDVLEYDITLTLE